ncbi:MAG: glycosyltransferase [Planctomycetes bacterium]|nr:glycosyltransferase [Planctomycetota bacterium]
MRFAILIPARDELAAVERKIKNTHALLLPPSHEPHIAVWIDDHSNDGSRECAEKWIQQMPSRGDLEWRVIRNTGAPGKANALAEGFHEAAGFEIIIMTDADALVSPSSPLATARAFADPRVGAATGMQQYVERMELLQTSGDREDLYDIASEAVRVLESRAGALFSVHGPWFAVRASAGARPRPGVAADDLDLALQIRKRGWRVVAMRSAVFYEVKPAGADLYNQQMRRARAYFEAVDLHFREWLQFRPPVLGALQFLFYAFAPPLLALLLFASVALAPVVLLLKTGDPAFAGSVLLLFAAIYQIPAAARVVRYAEVILRARLSPARAGADRWRPFPRA